MEEGNNEKTPICSQINVFSYYFHITNNTPGEESSYPCSSVGKGAQCTLLVPTCQVNTVVFYDDDEGVDEEIEMEKDAGKDTKTACSSDSASTKEDS